ncbi:MAG TPA: FAD/NAD(P)-binding oxidoreductase [Candidatus Thermoplasmatota archaeon]
MPRVVILGGGFGGLTVASELAARKFRSVEITLVEQRPTYVMGLAKLWALDGRRPLGAAGREYVDLEPRGIRLIRGMVRNIDLERRRVRVDRTEHDYDVLVVALGAELAPDHIPGFLPTMDLYTEDGVEHLRRQLETIDKGRVLVMISSMPFKCPPAPYEAALLVDALLRKRRVRENVEMRLSTPEPYPLPVAPPEYGNQLSALLASKNIDYQPKHTPTRIDATTGVVQYENGATFEFDVLVGVPSHRAPAVVQDAGLTDETGWIPVDAATLRTRHPNVWAVGDIVSIRLPNGKLLPKAGTLAANQGYVAAQQITAQIQGQPSTANFDGRGVCYIETGDGNAIPGNGSFFARPHPTFEFGPASAQGLQEKERFEKDFLRRWFG